MNNVLYIFILAVLIMVSACVQTKEGTIPIPVTNQLNDLTSYYLSERINDCTSRIEFMDTVIIPDQERTRFGFANNKTIGNIECSIAGHNNPDHGLSKLKHILLDLDCLIGMEVLAVMKLFCSGEDYEACVTEFSKPESKSKRYMLEGTIRHFSCFGLVIRDGRIEGVSGCRVWDSH